MGNRCREFLPDCPLSIVNCSVSSVAIFVFLAATAWTRVVASHFRPCFHDGSVATLLLSLWLAGSTLLSLGTWICLLGFGILLAATVGVAHLLHLQWEIARYRHIARHLRCRSRGACRLLLLLLLLLLHLLRIGLQWYKSTHQQRYCLGVHVVEHRGK